MILVSKRLALFLGLLHCFVDSFLDCKAKHFNLVQVNLFVIQVHHVAVIFAGVSDSSVSLLVQDEGVCVDIAVLG